MHFKNQRQSDRGRPDSLGGASRSIGQTNHRITSRRDEDKHGHYFGAFPSQEMWHDTRSLVLFEHIPRIRSNDRTSSGYSGYYH